jgi:hypothetical protein
LPCWNSPSLRRRSLRLSEDGLSFSQWAGLLIDQCAEMGISVDSLPSVSNLGIPGISDLDFGRIAWGGRSESSSDAATASLHDLFDRRAEIISSYTRPHTVPTAARAASNCRPWGDCLAGTEQS